MAHRGGVYSAPATILSKRELETRRAEHLGHHLVIITPYQTIDSSRLQKSGDYLSMDWVSRMVKMCSKNVWDLE